MTQQNNYLSHSGTLGMRWGFRRYQNKDGTLTEAGRLRYGNKSTNKRGAKLAEVTVKRKMNTEAKVKANAEKQAAKNEKLKADLLKSRDAKKIYKNAHLFSTKELGEISERLNAEKKIKDLSPSLVDKGRKTAEAIGVLGDTLNKISYATEKGISTYNNTAKIMNSIAGTNMKIIGEHKETRKGTVNKKMHYDLDGKLIKSEITKTDGYGNSYTEIRGKKDK